MAIAHKFSAADMPEIRRTRTRLLKYYKLNYKATRSDRIASAIIPDVNLQKLGITVDIMNQATKDALNKMTDSIKKFRTTMSKQLEEILFEAASSHYNTAVDECQAELFEDVIEMTEKYWDRMTSKPNHLPKPTKKTPKSSQKPKANHAVKTPSQSTPRAKSPAKSPAMSKPVTRPSTVSKSTRKTPMTMPGPSTKSSPKVTLNNTQYKSTARTTQSTIHQATKSSLKATNSRNQPKSTPLTTTSSVNQASTQSTMSKYFKTTKSSVLTRQPIFPSSSTFTFSKKAPPKPFRN